LPLLNGIDDHRTAALRGVLTPLKTLAERLGAAVVLVSHATKGGSGNRKHRVLGSIAYVGACRANHFFVADPHVPTGRRALMLDNGGNMSAPAPTLVYVIEDRGKGARVEWLEEPVAITIEEALRPKAPQALNGRQAGDRLECDAWLHAFLAGGVKPAAEVMNAGTAAGFSKDQIRRAKHRIGAVARRQGFGVDGGWFWKLGAHAITR
jgi:hypothetical protein